MVQGRTGSTADLPATVPAPASVRGALPVHLPASEREFYGRYPWCLNPFLTVREVSERLREELERGDQRLEGWQRDEVRVNVWLLACALSNTVDDYLRGDSYELPRDTGLLSWAAAAVRSADRLADTARTGSASLRRVRRWRARWEAGVDEVVQVLVSGKAGWGEGMRGQGSERTARQEDCRAVPSAAHPLAQSLPGLPAALLDEPIKVPSGLQGMDLTQFDLVSLGRKLVATYPDRRRPVLVVGLRTAGSYFGPVLRAHLNAEGYQHLEGMTLRPGKGAGAWEAAQLAAAARREALIVLVDDPPSAGDTVAQAVKIALEAGCAVSQIAALFPIHPAAAAGVVPAHRKTLAHAGIGVLTLEPEEWYKHRLFEPAAVERRLREYFQARGYASAGVITAMPAAGAGLVLTPEPGQAAPRPPASEVTRRTRLKRRYEVRLQSPAGAVETRYVLAKSVGWGYWAYRAFQVGERLSQFVPPILGLRDGILYTEWLPGQWTGDEEWGMKDSGTIGCRLSAAGPAKPTVDQTDGPWPTAHSSPSMADSRAPRVVAAYVAARARSLGLGKDPAAALTRTGQHYGFALLARTLSRAYGSELAALLMRERVRRELSRLVSPFPTLIDGRMAPAEWVAGAGASREHDGPAAVPPAGDPGTGPELLLLKTDFEQHGLGKNELNVTDPAADLSEAILALRLSERDETTLLDLYVAASGDAGVAERLFPFKLLAGLTAMAGALERLSHPGVTGGHQELHQQYLEAWNFLTRQTARFCAGFCPRPEARGWRSPLAVLDIDGVLDRRIFGFPSTTAAGIQAITLLHTHGMAAAVNTARSLREVQEYCRAYRLVGGVAEYGSALWDAEGNRARLLLSPETLDQLAAVRQALAAIPGVFVDGGYHASIRAFTYQGKGTAPLPALMVWQVMARLKADRLVSRQNTIDTAIIAREADKGSGLRALLDWVGHPDLETLAIGDSEPDLAMFRVASRCFAPAQIHCRGDARSLGCQIAARCGPPGLLSIVRSLIHPDGRRCRRCRTREPPWPQGAGTFAACFLHLLEVADQRTLTLLARALLDPLAVQALRK